MLCYATVLFKNHDNNEDLNLAFFNTAVTEISILLKKKLLSSPSMTTNFLTLAFVITVTFNSKTKVVQGALQSLTNQIAVFFEWTNEKAVFGPRDFGREKKFFGGLDLSLGSSPARSTWDRGHRK